MYKKIMVPVDLGHLDRVEKAVAVAADMAKGYGAEAVLVGVTQSSPTSVAPSPEAFGEKLSAYAAEKSGALGVDFGAHTEISHDITVDLDAILSSAAGTMDADLVVMASHVPGFADRVFASNAGYLASHATISVFVVR
ncbi:MAG: universal stress protein [Pseudomonadota bacterium]